MQATLGNVKIKMQDNPKKTGASAFVVLVVLLAGMYHFGIGDEQPENNTDFSYGELDPQPDNESNESSDNDVSENNSINVSVTNQTCVDHRNGSNYCTNT